MGDGVKVAVAEGVGVAGIVVGVAIGVGKTVAVAASVGVIVTFSLFDKADCPFIGVIVVSFSEEESQPTRIVRPIRMKIRCR